jgi:metal-responsive CopG/Arc/MetJ family transcriptional regulator
MKTAVSLPDPLFKAAETLAGKLGMSRSRLYATALEEFILRHQARHVSEQLDAVYSSEASDLDSQITKAQTSSLQDGDW